MAFQTSELTSVTIRRVTIWDPHILDLCIEIRIVLYLNTYSGTVRCQWNIVNSMKAETPEIRRTGHNLLLQWMEYLLLQLPLVESKHDFAELNTKLFPSIWSEKKYVFWLILITNTCAYSFMWITIPWVRRFDMYHSDYLVAIWYIRLIADAPCSIDKFVFVSWQSAHPIMTQGLLKTWYKEV